jgi:hypothetical protein
LTAPCPASGLSGIWVPNADSCCIRRGTSIAHHCLLFMCSGRPGAIEKASKRLTALAWFPLAVE